MDRWRKIFIKAAPIVIATAAWWMVTGIGSTLDHHVAVSVHVH